MLGGPLAKPFFGGPQFIVIAKDLIATLSADGDDVPVLGARQFLRLALRTWPFIRPMLKHLITLVVAGSVSGVIVSLLWVLANDLFYNKVLVGEKLQPFQALMLAVDESYVRTAPDTAPDESADQPADRGESADHGESAQAGDPAEPSLTVAQRKVVRDRFIILFAIGALLVLGIIATLPYYGTWIRHRINQALRVAMIERAERLSLKYHSHARVGDSVFRVYQDSAMIVNLVEEALIEPITMLCVLLYGLVFIAFFSPSMALACVLALLPMVWLTVRFTPRIRRRALANRRANSDLTSRLQEAFAAIKVVKANRAEGRVLKRFDDDSHRALNAAFYFRLEMVLLSAAVMVVGGALVIGTEYVLASWVLEDKETFLGAAVAAVVGFTVWNVGSFNIGRDQIESSAGTSTQLVRIWCMLQDMFIGLQRAFFLLDLEPDIVDDAAPEDFPAAVRQVRCADVHFQYEVDRPVLAGVDLVAEAGTITAIVGSTGAGKSTLMSMLLRLYDPDRGQVSFDGIDIRKLRVDDIRANTAIALQKNVLFAATVADNIGYAAVSAQRADIEAAAEVACADEFIAEMANGYDTELGERGGKLSTGQRQRLSIARAIVRDTPILILDEPTASLDANTERRLLRNLAAWGKDRVVFLITHRLSTIRNADQIALLERGRIVEHGRHDELIARPDGRYRAFVAAETRGAAA